MEKLSYKLEVFEGPLDLLLSLIAKNKLNIYDIPISLLLDQYMEQIDLMRDEEMEISSEFLEMASRLVQIKTASLLPRDEENEDPRTELTGQLLEYLQCKAVAQMLFQSYSADALIRPAEKIPLDLTYHRVHDAAELASALQAALGRGKSLLPPKPESFSALVSGKIVSVASQTVYVLRRLWRRGRISFNSLFAGKRDRSERVAAFLAVLEMVKNRRIRIEGEGDSCEVELIGKGGKLGERRTAGED